MVLTVSANASMRTASTQTVHLLGVGIIIRQQAAQLKTAIAAAGRLRAPSSRHTRCYSIRPGLHTVLVTDNCVRAGTTLMLSCVSPGVSPPHSPEAAPASCCLWTSRVMPKLIELFTQHPCRAWQG